MTTLVEGNLQITLPAEARARKEDLGPPELSNRADDLKRKLPVVETLPGRWKRRIVDDCQIFNIRSWNEALPAAFRLERVDT